MSDLGALIRSRRAIRKFRDGAVPERDMREVLEAARWAPSPANLQP
ncbi:MAG: nitroreductase family protein, partial [Chloroflexi bacterium]